MQCEVVFCYADYSAYTIKVYDLTINLLMVAGLSAEIFVDKLARVSRFMDNLQTYHVWG